MEAQQAWREKMVKGQTNFGNLNSAHSRSQAKCQRVRTIHIKRVKGFLLGHIINIL